MIEVEWMFVFFINFVNRVGMLNLINYNVIFRNYLFLVCDNGD